MERGGAGEERKYYEAIEDFIKSDGWYDRLLDLQGRDREYCIASMNVYKAGYRSGESAKVVGAVTMDSVNNYEQRGREYAVAFLEAIERRYANDAEATAGSPNPALVASSFIPTWPAKVLWGVIAMLLWALLPMNPYAYYIVLRWVVCITFLWLGRRAWERKLFSWAFPLYAISVLYNPITRVPLSRAVWTVVNIATALVISGFAVTSRHRAN